MKRLFTLALAVILTLSLAACGGGNTPSGGNSNTTPPTSGNNSTPGGSTTTTPPEENGLVGKTGDAAEYGIFDGTAIKWVCIAVDTSDKENQRALLISKDILFEMKYFEADGENNPVTWETSTLRTYLNGEFFTKAFTNEQAAIILSTEVAADSNSEYGVDGGNNTTDKVFILSASEVMQYFNTKEARAATWKGDGYDYWARTPGENNASAFIIRWDGELKSDGYDANGPYGVRPAIWVDITPNENSN